MMKKLLPLLMPLFVPGDALANYLINGNFESFSVSPGEYETFTNLQVPGWQSTVNEIEIWGNQYRGIPSYEGIRFVTLPPSTGLYQDIMLFDTSVISWSFAHRPRAGTDVLNFKIIDLQNNSTVVDESFSNQLPRWTLYSGIFVGKSSEFRVSFDSVATISGNNGNNLIGNYIDDVRVGYVPSPGSLAILLVAGLFVRKRR